MKKLLLALFLVLPISASAGEYLIKLNAFHIMGLDQDSAFAGLNVLDVHAPGEFVVVDIPDADFAEVVSNINADYSIDYIVENYKVYAVQNDENPLALRDQWAIAKVNAEKAWQLAGNKGNHDIVVAVVDTGVDYNHESLAMNMVSGYDYRDNDADPMDETSSKNPGHGTHVAGIVGATGLVEQGTVGLSPTVSIMPVRFLGSDGSGTLQGAIKAMDFAVEKGVKIMQNSWGAEVSASQAQPIIDAVKRASDAGVIVINAAGNSGKSNDVAGFYPANAKFANTITVAASDESDAKPSWSNYGQKIVDVASPGDNIMSTIPNNSYKSLRGTSMATPLVSGLVALLAAQNPEITGAQALAVLQATGAKVSIETACNCRVDAGAAMEVLTNNTLVVVPNALTLAPNETYQFSGFQGEAPYTFASSAANVATIDANGMLKAVAVGQTTVTVTDAAGNTATSLPIRVATGSDNKNPGGECPLGDPALCELICGIMPDAPFCQ